MLAFGAGGESPWLTVIKPEIQVPWAECCNLMLFQEIILFPIGKNQMIQCTKSVASSSLDT